MNRCIACGTPHWDTDNLLAFDPRPLTTNPNDPRRSLHKPSFSSLTIRHICRSCVRELHRMLEGITPLQALQGEGTCRSAAARNARPHTAPNAAGK